MSSQIVPLGEYLGDLLRCVGHVELEPVRRFVVADHYRVGNRVGRRWLNSISLNFETQFGHVVEEDVPARTVHIWELMKDARGVAVMETLDRGVVDNPDTQTYLAHMFQLIVLSEKSLCHMGKYVNFSCKYSTTDGQFWMPLWGVGDTIVEVGATVSSHPNNWGRHTRVSSG